MLGDRKQVRPPEPSAVQEPEDGHTDGYDCWCAPVFRDADGHPLTRDEAEQSWDAVTVVHQPSQPDPQPVRLTGDATG